MNNLDFGADFVVKIDTESGIVNISSVVGGFNGLDRVGILNALRFHWHYSKEIEQDRMREQERGNTGKVITMNDGRKTRPRNAFKPKDKCDR